MAACDTITVEEMKEAILNVVSLDVPSTVTVGESFKVTAVVENTGNIEGTGTVVFTQDGSEINRASVTVPAGSSVNVSFNHSIGTAGTFDICAEVR